MRLVCQMGIGSLFYKEGLCFESLSNVQCPFGTTAREPCVQKIDPC